MISYEPFWKTLKEKGVSTYVLINKYNISSETFDRIRKGKGLNISTIDDFCKILNCKVEDIIEYVEDNK